MYKKIKDLDTVKELLKAEMPLNDLIQLVDSECARIKGSNPNPIERVNDHLYKKMCDMDTHPIGDDGVKDSTPSFTICPQKELWHCFGCGNHGDRFEYIGQKYNLTFMEAIDKCAELENFSLIPYLEDVSPEEQIRNKLFSENNEARNIANNCLYDSDKALDYLHGRGITDDSIDIYKIGYAPAITGDVGMFSSIASEKSLQLDRKSQFNDAILFPINDAYGNMRYFQSRPFNAPPGMKYIGGDDTHPLFNDTDRIFGFDIAKRMLMKNKGRLVGVEGAPDTIACMQKGILTVGFLGTALNQDTFALLDKYHVNELVMLLDGDKAGRDKSFKNAEKYMSFDTKVKLKIALMPEGYDPEEYINKFGEQELIKCIDNAVYAIQYIIDCLWVGADTPTAKMEYMYNIRPYMVLITDKITRQIMISHISSKIGLDPVQIDDYYAESAVDINGDKLYSISGEEILLAEALRNNEFIPELTMRFKDDDWYLLRHKHLFRLLKSTEYTDIESLYTKIKNLSLNDVITYGWLEELYKNSGNVEFALKDIEDKVIRRKAIMVVDKARNGLYDMSSDVSIVIDHSTTGLFDTVHTKTAEKVYDAKSQVVNTMNEILNRMINPVDIVGDSFGPSFKILDKYTLGNQSKTLTVIAANQSVGKTQLCQNFAISQTTDSNIPILWFSLEMDYIKMTYRNLAILSGVSAADMMTGNITPEKKMIIDQQAIRLMNSQFYVSEKGHDLSESLAIARRYVQTKHVKKIYVDYIQLQYISDKRSETRSRELGQISKAWVEFAHDMDVSVILISQLGRQALLKDVAEAEDGFGSYEVAQDADVYITIKDKSAEEIEMRGIDHGNKTMNISKNRNGMKTVLIDLYADGPTFRMTEVGKVE